MDITRPVAVKVEYQDLSLATKTIEADDNILAVCLQHEIDHTRGITMLDHRSETELKQMLFMQLWKQQRMVQQLEMSQEESEAYSEEPQAPREDEGK